MLTCTRIWLSATALFVSVSAGAASLEFVNCPSDASRTCISGIQDVIVDGAAYNVDFRKGTFDDFLAQGFFPFFGDQARTEAARASINALLNPTNVQRIDYEGVSDASVYGLAFQRLDPEGHELDGFARVAVGTCIPETAGALNCWGGRDYLRFLHPTADYEFAVLSAVVPLPAAGWLLVSAFAAAGAMARKRPASSPNR